MNADAQGKPKYTKDDFVSGQEVRWCPGCGDYSILATMQRTLASNDVPRSNHVFVSGIGCSSRFPYYMNTYGFHTIHGRAPTIATGLKCANPELYLWVITGDGDGLSIGGNHLVHCMRRNMDINILLVNNKIYGLTKGQYSPTSESGKVTKSSPQGTIDYPINPLCIAIASEATFIARTLDVDPRHMGMVLDRAVKHRGISFIEIYQNCNIFNNKSHESVIGKETRDERIIYLENGKPLVFGKNKDKAIRLSGALSEIVEYQEGQAIEGLVVHDEDSPDTSYPYMLTQMQYPRMPVPFGILRAVQRPTYVQMLKQQIKHEHETKGDGDLKELIYGYNTWTVA